MIAMQKVKSVHTKTPSAGLKIMHGAVFEVRTAVLNPLGEFTFIETPLTADLESPR